jgi:predicted O-linked N-acetylglucosamine transferase (SPINDLY family)
VLTGEADAASPRDRLAAALAHHRAGHAAEAEAAYRALIAIEPGHADALNLLGVLRLQAGAADEAATLIERAVTARPEVADYRNNHGEALRTLGRLDEAAHAFRAALERDPGQANALNNLGMVALARDQHEAARDCFAGAIAITDQPARYHANLGRALLACGDAKAAANALSNACARAPEQADLHRLLGVAFHKAGRPNRALECLWQAAALAPDHAATHSQIGLVLHGQSDLEGAITGFRAALAIDSEFAEAANNLGVALADSGAPDKAIEAYRQALVGNPGSGDTHNNLAMALQKLGLLSDAESHFESALKYSPDRPDILNNFGNLKVEQGRVADGLRFYERALAIDPAHDDAFVNLLARSNLICDWTRRTALLPELTARVADIKRQPGRASSLIPLTFTLPYFSDDNGLISDICRLVGEHFETKAGPPIVRDASRDKDPDRRLRIGYLSPDFGDHPISHVTLPIYRLHDCSEVEVTCYATLERSAAGGHYLDEIKDSADHFVDLSRASFRDAARRIADDRIDILIDMTGYMRHSRPQVLALRPAPIQLYWQGHPGSLGGSFVDYVIGDPMVMPADDERYYTEKIIRLPDTFSSADRHPISDTPGSRADYALPENAFVYCAFNNPLKIEPEVFAAWMRILAAVPDSVLWLSRTSDPAAGENLKAAAEAAGVGATRLVFATRVPDKRVHLARHALADLFLDTFHFNASTTALDALWAGLPTLTRCGNNAYSRLCASCLQAIGLPDLITETTEDYVDRAITLARDAEARRTLKAKLWKQRETAPLFDTARFTRHLEAAYRHVWRRHVAGKPAESFDQPLIGTG